MRRIYESNALVREDQPFVPQEKEDRYTPQSFRWIDSSSWSDRIIPHRLRRRCVTLEVTGPRRPCSPGETVPFIVEMRNRLPIPISLRTPTPVFWSWSVDGAEAATRVSLHDPPSCATDFRFDRGERKRFERRWSGKFRISEERWRPAAPGRYTIRAWINVTATPPNLVDETVVRIEE